jgi:hypothetical protein
MLGKWTRKDGSPDSRKRELLEFVRALDTQAKRLDPKLEPIVLAARKGSHSKAVPKLPLAVPKGTWAQIDTSYVAGLQRVPETLHAMLQFIGDCYRKDEPGATLSKYGIAFAAKNKQLKWKVGQAYRQNPVDNLVQSL